jgi:hypothetical protein
MGEYQLTAEDILENRRFQDVAAGSGRTMNVHSTTGGNLNQERGGQMWIEAKEPLGVDIPLRLWGCARTPVLICRPLF